ncbi:type VII secretion protein EssC [Halobacillus shinanisalinarum]|uniref:Type VII secretion protein EssC n=1 Tax=Halobacillus shinanisalinarum TaxID=2932258 RepID=A0ABY4H2P2_9BACI|nr:type VII secretion protein EssC [Halobacillus shinanisalinarum]UOQ94561.1 type VII secretion protein EssC [Halobacillus shinanisalinarum]
MSQLYIFYKNQYQCYPINDDQELDIQIGNGEHFDLSLRTLELDEEPIRIQKGIRENNLKVIQGEKQQEALMDGETSTIVTGSDTLSIVHKSSNRSDATYYVGHHNEITIGSHDGAMIRKEPVSPSEDSPFGFSLFRRKQGWILKTKSSSSVFVNGQEIEERMNIQVGDVIFSPFLTLTFTDDDMLMASSEENYKSQLTLSKLPISEMKKQYPHYRRTPRMIYDLPEEKVTFSSPGQEGDDNQRSLWLIILPPLVMLIVMGVVALVIPRGIFILISIMMFTTTLITSTVQYFKERRRTKEREEKRHRVYNNYLEQKREELQSLREKQKEVLFYHFPSFERMKYLTSYISDRIWERTLESEDFLELRMGKATVPARYEVSVGSGDFANREIDDLLEKSQQMVQAYNYVNNVPLSIRLAEGPLGMVGKRSIVRKEIHQLIGQLAFFHSYHDVRFITIFNEEEYEEWKWIKWLPHIQLPQSFAKGLIYNEQTRDQLLSSIYAMVRDRDLDEDRSKKIFTPHLIFIVTDQQLISEHVIMEYLESEAEHLGISVVFATDTKESLSNHIHTLVRYVNDREGEILIEEGKAAHKPFALDDHNHEGNESYARMLHSLEHLTGVNNSIPEVVSFLELLHANDAGQLPIQQNWVTNQSSKSLAVPIGLKGREDVVELNLHEKAHGPHGLLAGTTGSGKSELLQTYILSLAVHYHPHEVAFLLIDYKGGGMAQPFENIPHLLGTITNINESSNFSARALASINSELKRRQTLFDRYKVNHINDYTNLYKEGKADDPLPHLFLISDEFAELKNEEPEFIRELVSTARIGRSLGVHLILATQKPGGIIDDQIWSNSRFRIALQVQDANDSKEILKNSDAADLKVTGRGYLQVGNNEIYELFQSAWSGAPYQSDTYEGENEVSIVTDLGLIRVSDVEAPTDQGQSRKLTEIEATVEQISEVQETMGLKKLASPWLPPLPARLFRQEDMKLEEGQFAVAFKDEPEKQSQDPYIYDFINDGNIGIFGSPGFGKSTTAMTLLLDFAKVYNPEQLHYYMFDFGNGALLPLRQLPHTADYFRYDNHRKIEKFMKLMKSEIEHRKQLFLESEVSTIRLYNQLNEEKLPIIFITIDNFDLVKEELQDLENQFIQFARDGQTLGIFMIFTATRINSVRQPLMNNLKTKVIHYLMDASEKYSLVGRTPYEVEAVPGRAIINKETSYLTQIFLPAHGDDDLAVLYHVKEQVQEIQQSCRGMREPDTIPMLPARLDYESFIESYVTAPSDDRVAVGLDEETVKPITIDLTSHCLVTGQSRNGKTNVLRVIIQQLSDQPIESMAIFDGMDRGLSEFNKVEKVSYIETKEQIQDWLNHIEQLLIQREKAFLDTIQEKSNHHESQGAICLLVDSHSRFQQTIDSTIQGKIASLMKQYSHLGFRLIIAGNVNEFTKGFDPLSNELKQIRQAVLLMKKSEQSLFTLPFSRKEAEIQPGYGYYVLNGKERKIQIPSSESVGVKI